MAIYASKYEKKQDYRASNEFSTPSLQIYGTQQGANPMCSDEKSESSRRMGQHAPRSNVNVNMNQYQAQSMHPAPAKPMAMKSKLRLLKKRKKSVPSRMKRNDEHDLEIQSHRQPFSNRNAVRTVQAHAPQLPPDDMGGEIHAIRQRIKSIEHELRSPSLSSAKKFALNKSLKMEKSKIIRHQRKAAQEKRRFEAGL